MVSSTFSRSRVLVCLLCCASALPSWAQDTNFSGRLTYGFNWNQENDGSLLAGALPSEVSQLGFALDVSQNNFLEGRLFASLAGYVREAPNNTFDESLDLTFNEAFYSFDVNDLTVIAGRKRTRWGVGLVSSPTDIISAAASPIRPNDDFYQIEGRDLLQLSYTGSASSFDFLLLTEEPEARHLEQNALAMRYYTNLNGVDMSIVGGLEENDEYVVGANLSFTVGQSLELHAGVLYDSDALSRQFTIVPPGAVQFDRSSSTSALVGGQWTSSNDINVIVEYLHFDNGLSNSQVETLVNTNTLPAVYAAGDAPELLQTHYIFGRVAKDDVWDGVDLEYSALASLENGGALHTMRLTKNIDEYFSAFGEISATTGGAATEFGQYPIDASFRIGLTAEF